MAQQRRTVVSAWLGLVVLMAPVTVACTSAEDVPARQSDVVAVAEVRAGSTGAVKAARTTVAKTKPVIKPVTKTATATVTKTVTKTRTVTQTTTVTAAPKTVRLTAPPTTVTVQAPATTVTETVVETKTAAAAARGLVDTGSVYFENCDAARAAGAAPVRSGDPGYRSGLDRDGDGVGCE